MSDEPKKVSWSQAEILQALKSYPGMTALYKELSRREDSPNFTEPEVVGPGVFQLSNPQGTSLTPGSPDFFGGEEWIYSQMLFSIAVGERGKQVFPFPMGPRTKSDPNAWVTPETPEEFQTFDKKCVDKLKQLLAAGRLQ